MKQFRKSAVAAAIGLGTLALLATPGFTAGDHGATKAGAPVQRVHMGQDQGGQWKGQPCPMGMMGPGMMGSGMGGQGMMGPGMMGPGTGGQGMMGQGMMGPGMMGPGMMGPGTGGQGMLSKDLSSDDVRHFLEHRLEMQGNKRLTLGEVKEADDDKIIADITTVDGSLVERLEVDRHTGQMQHVE